MLEIYLEPQHEAELLGEVHSHMAKVMMVVHGNLVVAKRE